MKAIYIFLISLFLTNANVFAWEVVKEADDFFLENKNLSIKHKANLTGGDVKFKKTERKGDRVELIIYDSGTAGTSVMVTVDRAIIYDIKGKKILGDFPYQYHVDKDAPYGFQQPEWKFEGNRISISDTNIGLKKTIFFD